MATISESSVLESLFQSALEEHEIQAEINLVRHPLAAQLEHCNTVESITELLRGQEPAFHELRGDNKAIALLQQTVEVLHKLSAIVIVESLDLPLRLVKTIYTGIGTLLVAAKDVNASHDPCMDLFESICNLLLRLDIYTKIRATKFMGEMIVKIFVQLISTLAVATKQIKEGRLKKFRMKVFGNNNVEAVQHRLDRLTLDEALLTAAQILEVVHGLVENLKNAVSDDETKTDGIQNALEKMQELTSDVNRSRRDEVQRMVQTWFHLPDSWINQKIEQKAWQKAWQKARHERTGKWLIEGDTFAEWKTRDGSLLWIHGKPGSGKTVLCSSIIENVEDMRKSGLASLAFYYFGLWDDQKQDRRRLLVSLLFQLCDQSDSYFFTLSRLYSAHNEDWLGASDASLAQCLQDMLCSPGQAPVYLILDALDECPNPPDTLSPRENVLMLLEDLVNLRLSNLHICVTSRPEVDIKTVLDSLNFCSISLHDEEGQKQDIYDYVESIVQSDPQTRRWRAEDKELVIDVLSTNVNGIFRWVLSQFDILRRCLPCRIRFALNELPTTLDATYDRLLENIDERDWEYALRLFQFIAVALRPLRIEELAEFLALDFEAGPIPTFREDWRLQDPEAVLAMCSPFLAIVDVGDTEVIRFSHSSVKEYLTSSRLAEKSDNSSRRYHISIPSAHALITQACLGMLLHLDVGITTDGLQNFPLAKYAAEHWVDHVRFENVSANTEDGIKQLFDPTRPHFATWVWIHEPELPFFLRSERGELPSEPGGTPLHYASLLGLDTIVKFLVVERLQDVQSPGFSDELVPLHLAGVLGHVEVAQILLDHGADVGIQDTYKWTPLHYASYWGHVELARIFLDRGAKPTAPVTTSWTPLHFALYRGHVELACVLLERGADLTAQDDHTRTPLYMAITSGHVEPVRALLEHTTDNATVLNKDGWNPIHLALDRGHVKLARVLVDHGADVMAKDGHGSTALHLASKGGHVELTYALLEHGAGVNAQDKNNETPLHCASKNGHLEVTRILLDHGADPNAQDNDSCTPFHRALQYGHAQIVSSLFDRGANANERDTYNCTPLHHASQHGHLEVFRFLLEHDADLNPRDHSDWTLLHAASSQGHSGVVQFLLERGANADALDRGGWTPLQLPARRGHLGVVWVLLKHGVDVNTRDNGNWTPLHGASQRGDPEVVQLLLKFGADSNALDDSNQAPLHLASRGGHLGVMQLLVEHSAASIHVRSNKGRTPFQEASAGGHHDVMQLLLEHGAEEDVVE